ncbi:TAP42-like protein, partial [Rhizoclosmatium globosum]
RITSTRFEEAQRLFNSLEESELPCGCDEYQTKVSTALSLLSSCQSMVRELGIFSENEPIDEINTLDLRFLLIDYYSSVLSLKQQPQHAPNLIRSVATKNQDRIAVLKSSLASFDSFLFALEMIDALADDDKLFVLDPNAAFAVPKDPALARAAKIERFKREKALKEKLKVLQAAVDEARKDTAKSSGNNNNKKEDEEPVELRDDDLYRSLMLTTIQLCVQKSLEEMKMAREELDMLEQIAKMEAMPDTLLTKDGKPRQPFLITNQSKRQEFQKGVFQPGYNLPTMTVDEFLANEFARGNVISGGGKMPEKVVKEDLGEEADDLETYKARAWDEYKDDNPKGWGNRMNKG